MYHPALTKKGEIEKVTPDKIKLRDLLFKDENGVPAIIWIVAHNKLNRVPKSLLTDNVLSQQDLEGRSAYHLAAKWEQFKYVPKNLITPKILKEYGEGKETTWAILLRQFQINDVLPFIDGLIDEKDTGRESFLHVCASTGQLDRVPKQYLTEERIFDTVRRSNENVIDYAAYYGCLNQIPKEFVNEDSMSLTNSNNETPLHIAASAGTLHLIPKKFLTQENLEKEDNWGTVFHKAAACCTFDSFPKDFLTEENLIRKNKKIGMSPIYILAREYCESSKPGKREKAKEQFYHLLGTLSNRNLNYLKKELEEEDWLEASNLIKKKMFNRELLKKLKTEENTIEI